MIGIVGYSAHNESGLIVQHLREKLEIPADRHMTIYHYGSGGWDEKLAAGTWLNGFPQNQSQSGRWQWEVQSGDLEDWARMEKIRTVILVGSTFGWRTAQLCQRIGVHCFGIPLHAFNPQYEDFANVELNICINPKVTQNLPYPNKQELPYPIDNDDQRQLWLMTLQRSLII